MVYRAAPGAKPQACVRGPQIRSDTRGQFLLTSGVVVTLGFMLLATTMVTVNTWEERTQREQRDRLVDNVDEIVHTLEDALATVHREGQLNRSVFQDAATSVQSELEKNAVRSGLFTTIRLKDEADLADVQQDHCLGLDWDRTANGGVVYGWDEDTLKKSIVGVVYEIHVTDGEKSFRAEHYVALQECATDQIFTHAEQWSGPLGVLKNFTSSHLDNDAAAELTEELDWDNLVAVSVHPTVNQSSIEVDGWNKKENLLELNGAYTEMPSRSASFPPTGYNWFRFNVDPPQRMRQEDTLPNVTLEVTGYVGDNTTDQVMYLRVYDNDSYETPVIQEAVNLTGAPANTTQIVLDELHEGQGDWTYDDIVDSHWELTVNGPHEPSQQWYVDHFNMTGSIMTAQAYRFNMTFEWPEIPGVYTDHELTLRYGFTPATPDEGFLLEVRDRDGQIGGGQWMLVENMTDTTGSPDGWSGGTYTTAEGPGGPEPFPNHMEWRIVDSDHADNWIPDDEDTIEIALMRIKSQLN